MGAVRHKFPSMIAAETLQRCRYIQSFPHCLTLTSHLKEDLQGIAQFAKSVSVVDGRLHYPSESVASPTCLLSPTICFHYYAWLSGQSLEAPRTITALGNCFRYESKTMRSLERLWEFSMREIVFVGPQDYVLGQRDRCIALTVEILDELGLSYDIKTATDPFFIDGYSTQAAFQSAFELKYEIRADLPYEEEKSLAIGSFNFHQDFFGRSLDITLSSSERVTTGCVGFGLERVIWAFFAQHGPYPRGWPVEVQNMLERKAE